MGIGDRPHHAGGRAAQPRAARCMVAGGGHDHITPGTEAWRIFEGARCERELIYYPRGAHDCFNVLSDLRPRMVSWIARQLGPGVARPPPSSRDGDGRGARLERRRGGGSRLRGRAARGRADSPMARGAGPGRSGPLAMAMGPWLTGSRRGRAQDGPGAAAVVAVDRFGLGRALQRSFGAVHPPVCFIEQLLRPRLPVPQHDPSTQARTVRRSIVERARQA